MYLWTFQIHSCQISGNETAAGIALPLRGYITTFEMVPPPTWFWEPRTRFHETTDFNRLAFPAHLAISIPLILHPHLSHPGKCLPPGIRSIHDGIAERCMRCQPRRRMRAHNKAVQSTDSAIYLGRCLNYSVKSPSVKWGWRWSLPRTADRRFKWIFFWVFQVFI